MSSRLIATTSARMSLLSAARRHAAFPRWTRSVHERRPLAYPVEKGLGEFLPPKALEVLAVDLQEGLLQMLTDEVRDTENANHSVAQTVINTAGDRTQSLAFNYASEALNNSYFLDGLKPPPPPPAENHEDGLSTYLHTAIRHNEGSLTQLKSRVAATVMGMSSSGYVWFVTDQHGYTAVVPTYGAGTLLVRSRIQMSSVDGMVLGEALKIKSPFSSEGSAYPDPSAVAPPSPASRASGLSYSSSPLNPSNPVRSLHTTHTVMADSILSGAPSSLYSASTGRSGVSPTPYQNGRFDMSSLGETLWPLFCISVHERAWISAGYGVWGKEEWLKKFWTVLDWEKVSKAYVDCVPNASS